LDEIPFEERRAIDELVGLWQTRSETRDLLAHIRVTWKPGAGRVTSFFAQVRQDLLTDKHSKYTASSTFEFRQFLEAEYCRLDQLNTVRQAQAIAEAKRLAEAKAKAKEREENQRWLRAYFDGIDKEMANTNDRKERFELGLKREAIAPYTGVLYDYDRHCKNCFVGISSAINPRCPNCKGYICLKCECCFCEPDKHYENVCWKCHLEISKEICEFCSDCGWYICSNCRSCSKGCDKTYHPFHVEAVDPFLPDYPDDLS
jgi:hypothetical protein